MNSNVSGFCKEDDCDDFIGRDGLCSMHWVAQQGFGIREYDRMDMLQNSNRVLSKMVKNYGKMQHALKVAKAEIVEYRSLMKLQHSRTRAAEALWRKCNNLTDVTPDLGRLVSWLLDNFRAVKR